MNLPYRRSKLFICDDVLLERSVLVDSTVRDQTGKLLYGGTRIEFEQVVLTYTRCTTG